MPGLRDATNEQPQKDRRALLMEWRKQARNRGNHNNNNNNSSSSNRPSGTENVTPSSSSNTATMNYNSVSSNNNNNSNNVAKRSRLSLGMMSAPSPARLTLNDHHHHVPPLSTSSTGNTSSTQRNKRTAVATEGMYRPPSSAMSASASIVAEPMGATQRFRLAKEMRRQQQQQHLDDSYSQQLSQDFEEETGQQFNHHHSSTGTHSQHKSRRMSVLSSGAKKMRRKSISVFGNNAHNNYNNNGHVNGDRTCQSQLSQDSSSSVGNGNIEADGIQDVSSSSSSNNIGLKSRLVEMQQRIERLEQEKINLSMSKAPLESRLKQAEESFAKDRARLNEEISDMKSVAKNAGARFLSLEMERDGLKEEVSKLKLSALKAASSSNAANDHNHSNENSQLPVLHDPDDDPNPNVVSSKRRDHIVEQNNELKEKYRHAKEEIHCLKIDKISLESDLKATNMEYDSLFRAFEDLQEEFRDASKLSTTAKDAVIQLEALTTEHIATAAQLNAVCADLAETKSAAQVSLEQTQEAHKKEISELKFEVSVLRARRSCPAEGDSNGDALSDHTTEDSAVWKARVEERDERIRELEEHLFKSEQTRRIMHNRIQELRGNIRVFVRTRPFLPGDCCDSNNNDSPICVAPDGESLDIVRFDRDERETFAFDKVFSPSVGQDGVFTEVSDFVQSALDGFHVCLFSYGQTGSGKTHTMQGSGNGAMRGIIPRAVEQILNQVGVMSNQRWQFTMSASFLEIYNEELKDLLVGMSSTSLTRKDRRETSSARPSSSSSSSTTTKLAIKRDIKGKIYVDGLTKVKIVTSDTSEGMEQLEKVMITAARSRSVASTKMNSQSSRSHSVFMLHLRGVNQENGTVVQGSLNLCDLAGSERLSRSGAASDAKRLRETQAINKSLSSLGDVFTALANGASHIPFRNSKLTYLLQDCLSGDGKALMFVNLSPTAQSSHESLCSLRFAQRVNKVELGKAKKNVQYMK